MIVYSALLGYCLYSHSVRFAALIQNFAQEAWVSWFVRFVTVSGQRMLFCPGSLFHLFSSAFWVFNN